MSIESLNADRVFREKNMHLAIADELKDSAQFVSEQRVKSQAVAIDIARLCAKAASLSLAVRPLAGPSALTLVTNQPEPGRGATRAPGSSTKRKP